MNPNTIIQNQQLLGKLIFDLGIADSFNLDPTAPISIKNRNFRELVGFLINAGSDQMSTLKSRYHYGILGDEALNSININEE